MKMKKEKKDVVLWRRKAATAMFPIHLKALPNTDLLEKWTWPQQVTDESQNIQLHIYKIRAL